MAPLLQANREGGKVEIVSDFLFLVSKITADSDWSHEIRLFLLIGRKAMTIPESGLKSRHYSVDKGPYHQGCGPPGVVYDYESWIIKKAEL